MRARATFGALAWTFCAGMAMAECRQALAIGMDVSGSVDRTEYRLQLDGLAAALLDPEVQRAFLQFPETPVRLMIFEWSGRIDQRVVQDWTEVRDVSTLATMAALLRITTQAKANDSTTAISDAMVFGAAELNRQAACWQKTLDISGDGPANIGRHPMNVSDTELGNVTINGLVIGPSSRANTTKNLHNVKSLEDYYSEFILRGPGAFVETAQDHADFANAMRRKLIRELQLPNLSWDDRNAAAKPVRQ